MSLDIGCKAPIDTLRIAIHYNNWPHQYPPSLPSRSILVIPHFPTTRFCQTVVAPTPRGVTKPAKETILLRRDYPLRWLLLSGENKNRIKWLMRVTGKEPNQLNTTKKSLQKHESNAWRIGGRRALLSLHQHCKNKEYEKTTRNLGSNKRTETRHDNSPVLSTSNIYTLSSKNKITIGRSS